MDIWLVGVTQIHWEGKEKMIFPLFARAKESEINPSEITHSKC